MINLEKFNHSVNVLLKAYLNNTLQFGNYCACAVGNLLADAVGAKLVIVERINFKDKDIVWDNSVWTGSEWYADDEGYGDDLILQSGYSKEQIIKIEKSFEKSRKHFGTNIHDEDMFNGMMSVVDVLAEIHGIDLTIKDEAKALFLCKAK